jgi:hypothetical protein
MEKPRVWECGDVTGGSDVVKAVGVAGDVAVVVADVDAARLAIVGVYVMALRDRAAVAVCMAAAAARRRQEEHLNGETSMPTSRDAPALDAVSG